MFQRIYFMSLKDISEHAPDSDYHDSDGDPVPGWFADIGSPGCLPDSTYGPCDSPLELWLEATDEGQLCWPSLSGDHTRTRSILIIPDRGQDERIPYFVEMSEDYVKAIALMIDWGHSFIDAPAVEAWDTSWPIDKAPTIEESAFFDIARHGCASGSWMPAVTYASARQILQYADRLDDHFEFCGIDNKSVFGDETSLDNLACRVASLLCEDIAQMIDLEADVVRHREGDRP